MTLLKSSLCIAFLAFVCDSLVAPRICAAEERRFLLRNWQSGDGLPSSIVRSVTQASDGWLWVGTAEGLVRFDGVQFSGFAGEPDATLSRLPVHAIYALPHAAVWVVTVGGGLLRWDGQRLALVWNEAAPAPGKPTIRVSEVAAGPGGRTWIARGKEIWEADGQTPPKRVERTPEIDVALREEAEACAKHGRTPAADMAPVLFDRLGRCWRGSMAGGLTVARPGNDPESVPLGNGDGAVRIGELHEDREGAIWVATSERGLIQIREPRVQVLTTADGLANPALEAVLEDRAGNLWLSPKSGGVDELAGGLVTHFVAGPPTSTVASLYADQAGVVWAAARAGGIYRFEDGAFRAAFPEVSLPGRVVPMAQDGAGRLWFGGRHGLAVWADGRLVMESAERGLPAFEATALAVAADGSLWVGAANGSLLHGSVDGFKIVADPATLGGRSVSGLLPDREGALWATTLGSGLYLWKDGKISRFSEEEGLPDARLTAVLREGEMLWLGSLSGIFRVSIAELEAHARSGSGAIQWSRLDRSDGLLSRECAGLCQPSACVGADGQFWFPTMDGAVHFDPARLPQSAEAPPVALLDCRANGHSLALTEALRVGPGRPSLEFRYTALSFAAPEKVKFCVRLAGLDDRWRNVGPQRSTVFESLPPGSYRFEVKAANGDGIWNATGASLPVTVLPFFWETPWFRSAAAAAFALAAAGVGWLIARARHRREMARLEQQRARELERARIARDLHDDLGASLTEISLLARLAAEEPADSTHSREALPEIATKVQALVGTLDEIVWAVNPRHDTIESLAEYLAAFAAEFLETAGMALRLDIPRELPATTLDTEVRHDLFLAAREALNNAVKHSAATEIGLQIRADAGQLTIVISDNGRGFDTTQPSEGNGINNLSTRLTRLGGACQLASRIGAGATVRLSVPLPTHPNAPAKELRS